METINGFETKLFSLDKYHKVSDLIYFDGPILSHYINGDGDNFLLSWCDSNHEVNRWIFCKISLFNIHEYLQKKFSLKQLFESLSDNIIRVMDINDDLRVVKTYLIDYEELPKSYVPKEGSFYNFKPKFSQEADQYYLSIGESGVLQAIFNGSNKIGYGTIPLEIFSPAIHHLNQINNGLSDSYFKNKNKDRPTIKGNARAPRFKKEEVIPQTIFELAGTGPGSFKLYLVPQQSQKTIGKEPTETDNYFNFFFDFFNSGFDYEILKGMVEAVSSDVFTHFEKLLKVIEASKVNVQLKWNNPNSNVKNSMSLNYNEVSKAIDNINKLEFENAEELRLVGRFVEINLLNKHFTFIQELGDDKTEARGFFSKQVSDLIILIQFNKKYEVVISRSESKEIGDKKTKVKDTLTAYMVLNDQPNETIYNM